MPIRVHLTNEVIDLAADRANSFPVYKNSHREHEANLVGCIGELIFERYIRDCGIALRDMRNETTHDYLISNSITVDVKTKDRTVEPRDFFDCSVPLYNHEHQRPNYYYFISLRRAPAEPEDNPYRFEEAYILGGISPNELDSAGKRWKAGDIDPSNNTKFWTDCINVSIKQLLPNDQMLEAFRRAHRNE